MQVIFDRNIRTLSSTKYSTFMTEPNLVSSNNQRQNREWKTEVDFP